MSAKDYVINFTDDTKPTVTVIPNTVVGPSGNQRVTDIDLIGMGSVLWGEKTLENMIHMLENFSSGEDIHPIIAVTASTMTIAGDVERAFPPSRTFNIWASDNNNGSYIVLTSVYNGTTQTVVTITTSAFIVGGNLGNAGEQGVPNKALKFGATTPIEGQLWHNKTTNALYLYNLSGSPEVASWNNVLTLGSGSGTFLPLTGGTMTGNISMSSTSSILDVQALVLATGGSNFIDLNGAEIEAVGDPSNGANGMSRNYADNRYLELSGGTLTGDINMGNSRIENIADPNSGDDAMDRDYADNRYLQLSGGTMTGNISMSSTSSILDVQALVLATGGSNFIDLNGAEIEAVGDPSNGANGMSRNYADNRYLELSGGTLTGDITLNDNVDINIGNGSDLRLYHNGTSSFIESNTSSFVIDQRTNSANGLLRADNSGGVTRDCVRWGGAAPNVSLYTNGSLKFRTTSAGAEVFGTLTSSAAPTNVDHLTRKDYVDSVIPTIDTTTVNAAIAGSVLGSIGTYAFLVYPAGSTTPGNTRAGSALRYSSSGGHQYGTTIPAGTWRAMGWQWGVSWATVWVRIS